MLAPYAVTEQNSKGRQVTQPPHAYRSDFERDRDRVIHSSAFRRLEGKTQVFTPGLDDYYRTRLTHTIEVAQIGRTMAQALSLNQPLTEAICLAHDLGHAPFGHSGEHVLAQLMESHGGFEHNAQSLRIVTLLEHPYPEFMGLNLMYETRLGLAKHRSPYDDPAEQSFSEPQCTLEGQIADIADRIAYNCHDLEDGRRARLLENDDILKIPLVRWAWDQVDADHIQDWTIRRTRTSKALMNRLVSDCIETSSKALAETGIKTLTEVCQYERPLIGLSTALDQELQELERFLMQRFYLHPRLVEAAHQAEDHLSRLFTALCDEPTRMPGYFQKFISQYGRQRAVVDYIAGMTDRYCLRLVENC